MGIAVVQLLLLYTYGRKQWHPDKNDKHKLIRSSANENLPAIVWCPRQAPTAEYQPLY